MVKRNKINSRSKTISGQYLSQKEYEKALKRSYDVKPKLFSKVQSNLGSIREKSKNLEAKKETEKVSTSNLSKLGSAFSKAITPQKQKKAFNPQILKRPQLTREQEMLQEIMFNGERNWGTGNNLPRMDNTLNSGGGLINNGDINKETGRMFGLR